MGFDVQAAKKAGYSDAEIADHIAQQAKFDAAGARKSGYTDADIVRHLTGDQSQAAVAARRRVKNTPDQVRALTKGFSFSLADELDAGGAALETGANNLVRRMTGQKSVGYGMGDAYKAVMDANRSADNIFAQNHPVQNIGLQVAGGAVGPGAAAGSRYISGARTLARATGRSAAVGAGMGAVAGAGNASGGAVGRAKGAVGGAVTGAAVGAAAPSAGRVAQTAGRAVNAALGQPFGGASRGAVARLAEAMHQDGLAPADIQRTVAEWRRSGVTPEFLNVVGENTRALIRTAAGQQGAARNSAQAYRDQTVASIPNRAIERANSLTPGEARTPAQFAEGMRATREATAQANYGAWSDEPVTVPDAVKDMLSDASGRSIIARARADAIENQDWMRQAELDLLLRETQNGQLPRISAGTVDRLVIAARERGAGFAARGNGFRARGAYQRRGQLDGVLAGVEEAQPSRAAYQAHSQAIEAAEDGASVMGPRSEFDAAHQAISQNPFAIQGAQIRERQALRNTFGTRDQVRGQLGDIANAPDVRPNLEQLYGERGNLFADAAGRLVQKQDHANFVAPNTNSQTFSRGQDAKNKIGVVANIMEAMGGRIRPLVERVAHGLTITEREREILTQIGIGSPEDALAALRVAPPAPSRVGGAVARRAAVGAAPTAAARQGSVEVYLENDPSVRGRSSN